MRAQARTAEFLRHSARRRYSHTGRRSSGTGAGASSEAPDHNRGIEDKLSVAGDGPQSQSAIAFPAHRENTLRGARGRVRRSKKSGGGGSGDVHDFAGAAERVKAASLPQRASVARAATASERYFVVE